MRSDLTFCETDVRFSRSYPLTIPSISTISCGLSWIGCGYIVRGSTTARKGKSAGIGEIQRSFTGRSKTIAHRMTIENNGARQKRQDPYMYFIFYFLLCKIFCTFIVRSAPPEGASMDYVIIPRQIAYPLRAKRKELGLTQDELARAASVSRQLVNKTEAGLAPGIGLDRLLRMLEPLGLALAVVSLDDAEDERPRRDTAFQARTP